MIFILFGNFYQFTNPHVVGLVAAQYICWRRELTISFLSSRYGKIEFGVRQISNVYREEKAGKREKEVIKCHVAENVSFKEYCQFGN